MTSYLPWFRQNSAAVGFEELIAAGVVLTGGTSKMEGVTELAEEIFHMPVRIGTPVNVKGLSDIVNNPIYSTGVGLLHFGAQEPSAGKGLSDTGTGKLGFCAWNKVKRVFSGWDCKGQVTWLRNLIVRRK